MYDSKRYFIFTGNHMEGTPTKIEKRQTEVERLHKNLFGSKNENKTQGLEVVHGINNSYENSDLEEIINKAVNSKNGSKFILLLEGKIDDYPSHSEADLALCSFLARHCDNNTEKIDFLFRKSGLYREKWDEPHSSSGKTYGTLTIEKAMEKNNSKPNQNSQETEFSNDLADWPDPKPLPELLPKVEKFDHSILPESFQPGLWILQKECRSRWISLPLVYW